jgi:cytochrome c oxidase assembly protein subunit 15
MTALYSAPQAHRRAVRAWLLAVAALMVVTLVVGGATRLTESGLSIVEWRPVTGVVPPLDAAQWQTEFAKYRTIPQYRERNRGMSLDDFKTIYWWEWSHRLLARLVGAAFLLPLIWFMWRGDIEAGLRLRLWTIFGLGAALGAVGWWMVSSGLADRVNVSPYRLGFHLTLACIIYAMILWTAQQLRCATLGAGRIRIERDRPGSGLVQIYLGALVAGLRAGLIYNTWPLIDGGLLPEASRLLLQEPRWRNFFENTLTVQFDHRMAGYALLLCALLHAGDVARSVRGGVVLAGALALAAAILLQAVLGILTLVHQVPLALALAHQAMAIVVLTVAGHAQRLAHRRVVTAARAGSGRVLAAARRSRCRDAEGGSGMIEVHSSGDVALVHMAHGKANAMSIEFCRALTRRLEELDKSAARAVVITGRGRIFSAGVDLPRLLEGGAPYVREFPRR